MKWTGRTVRHAARIRSTSVNPVEAPLLALYYYTMSVLDGVEMLDVREAARLVRRTPETVRRWIWSGRLPARRHGNKLLVKRGDLDDLIGLRRHDDRMTLADWVNQQSAVRRSGALGRSSTGASAADLVVADREGREAG